MRSSPELVVNKNLFLIFFIDLNPKFIAIMTDCSDSQNHSNDNIEDADPLDPFLCFPELMTKHQLLKLFKMRYFSPPEDQLVDGYEYCNLIALYNRLLLPLPQRKYGNKRKSEELAVKQIECNKRPAIKRKSEETDPTNDISKKLRSSSIDESSSPEINDNPIAQHLSNQRHDSKRQKISWP